MSGRHRGPRRATVAIVLSGPGVEKPREILREASTPLKSSQRLDQRSFFVVEKLHLGAVFCREPRLQNHAKIIGRRVGRTRLKLLDEQLGGFRRDREVPLVDRHAELLCDEPPLLEVARQLVGRARRLSAPRGDMPKLAASLIPRPADPKTPSLNPRRGSSESLALTPRLLAQQDAELARQLAAGRRRKSLATAAPAPIASASTAAIAFVCTHARQALQQVAAIGACSPYFALAWVSRPFQVAFTSRL